jgi:hypothetical protein
LRRYRDINNGMNRLRLHDVSCDHRLTTSGSVTLLRAGYDETLPWNLGGCVPADARKRIKAEYFCGIQMIEK